MQAPFWKATGSQADMLKADFIAIARACASVGIHILVVPLVDGGRLESQAEEDQLVAFLLELQGLLAELGLIVTFESDFTPSEVARFISRLPEGGFGINYDIGNSAALGYSASEEFAAYGPRIVNVHVKDRVLGGTTVPLGTGNADFETVFSLLARWRYQGNLILQTARAIDGDHERVLCKYRDQVIQWMNCHEVAIRA